MINKEKIEKILNEIEDDLEELSALKYTYEELGAKFRSQEIEEIIKRISKSILYIKCEL